MSCTCEFGGTKTCHCSQCHSTFSAIGSFDKHQRMGDGGVICLDPETALREDGKPMFRPTRRHVGTVWAIADDRARTFPHI